MIVKLFAAVITALVGSGTRSASQGGPPIPRSPPPPPRNPSTRVWVPATRMKNGRIRKGHYRSR